MKKTGQLNTVSLTVILLGVLFIGLKLARQIDWPWWMVLGPFWMPQAILLAVAAALYAIGFVLRRRDAQRP